MAKNANYSPNPIALIRMYIAKLHFPGSLAVRGGT